LLLTEVMKYSAVLFLILIAGCSAAFSQEPATKNIIIVTLDGFRWKELFEGADKSILSNGKYVIDESVNQRFWTPSMEERKKTLMPFMWNIVANQGQLYGNRNYKNKVNCTNPHLLSYPGYSEMLVGYSDHKVSSNKKIDNPNSTVLEFLQGHQNFRGQVAVFTTWDAFPYILRESKSDIYVNAGNDRAEGAISGTETLLNELHRSSAMRSDSLTFQYALEYLKRERPRVTFIGFDETDSNAHGGRYDEYLKAANRVDDMLAQLWNWVQSQPDYQDQTTLFITTDHGRGKGKNSWQNHRLLAAGSRHIWFAVIGPDTPAFGEMKIRSKTYQNQVAKTIAAFLGLTYKNRESVGEVVQTMLIRPRIVNEDHSGTLHP
jgi:hypothetical protein